MADPPGQPQPTGASPNTTGRPKSKRDLEDLQLHDSFVDEELNSEHEGSLNTSTGDKTNIPLSPVAMAAARDIKSPELKKRQPPKEVWQTSQDLESSRNSAKSSTQTKIPESKVTKSSTDSPSTSVAAAVQSDVISKSPEDKEDKDQMDEEQWQTVQRLEKKKARNAKKYAKWQEKLAKKKALASLQKAQEKKEGKRPDKSQSQDAHSSSKNPQQKSGAQSKSSRPPPKDASSFPELAKSGSSEKTKPSGGSSGTNPWSKPKAPTTAPKLTAAEVAANAAKREEDQRRRQLALYIYMRGDSKIQMARKTWNIFSEVFGERIINMVRRKEATLEQTECYWTNFNEEAEHGIVSCTSKVAHDFLKNYINTTDFDGVEARAWSFGEEDGGYYCVNLLSQYNRFDPSEILQEGFENTGIKGSFEIIETFIFTDKEKHVGSRLMVIRVNSATKSELASAGFCLKYPLASLKLNPITRRHYLNLKSQVSANQTNTIDASNIEASVPAEEKSSLGKSNVSMSDKTGDLLGNLFDRSLDRSSERQSGAPGGVKSKVASNRVLTSSPVHQGQGKDFNPDLETIAEASMEETHNNDS